MKEIAAPAMTQTAAFETLWDLFVVLTSPLTVVPRVCRVLAFSVFWAVRSFPKIIWVSVQAFGLFASEGSH